MLIDRSSINDVRDLKKPGGQANVSPAKQIEKMRLTLVLLALTLAATAPQRCSDKIFAVNTMWFMNWTNIAPNSFCTYTFKIPKDSFAVIDLEVLHAYDDTVVTITDDFGNSLKRWQKTSNFTLNVAIPVTFQLHMKTGPDNDIMVQNLIDVKKAEYLNRVVDTIETDLNGPSSVIYFEEWMEGTSYIIKSNNKKVNVQYALLDYLRNDDMENIFVYDGNVLIGTFMNFIAQESLVSKTNKLTLFMAKQVYEKGAVLITDNSNLENLFDHELAFLPTYNSMNVTQSLIIGNATEGGAYTLIGARDGSNPVTVIELDIVALDPTITGQKFFVTPGGPVADLSQATPLTNATLPKQFTANVNTFYINKGIGSVKYFVH